MKAKVLLLGGRQEDLEYLTACPGKSYQVEAEGEPARGLKRVERGGFDLVLLEDEFLAPRKVLSSLGKQASGAFLIVMGEKPAAERVVSIILAGAFSYLVRPFSRSRLCATIDKGLKNRSSFLEIVNLAERLKRANVKLTRQKAKLEEEKAALRNKTLQLNFLKDLSLAINCSMNPERVVGNLIGWLRRLTPFEGFGLLFTDKTTKVGRIYLEGRLPEAEERQLALGLLGRYNSQQAGSGKLIRYEVINLDGHCRLESWPDNQITVPLLAGSECLGMMCLATKKRLKNDLEQTLESAATLVTLGLRNAEEHIKVQHMATSDALTNVLNRHAFEANLKRELHRAKRYKSPLSLIMADLDHFKGVNDRFGHQFGDVVLREVAECISETVRSSDIVARYGGEEFAVILPETNLKNSARMAERIRSLVEDRCFKNPPGISLTISAGVAELCKDRIGKASELIKMADEALYMAKCSGRNNIKTLSHSQARAHKPGMGPSCGLRASSTSR